MKDADIRPVLHHHLNRRYGAQSDTIVLDEFGIHNGSYRIDVAVVNGVLSGYEIKSAKDTLARLPSQASAYGDVFDHVTLVASECHIQQAMTVIPEWWAIVAALLPKRTISLEILRQGGKNPEINSRAVASLLWRDEAYALLCRRGVSKGLSAASRHRLWDALAVNLDLSDIQDEVRRAIRSRRANPHPELAQPACAAVP